MKHSILSALALFVCACTMTSCLSEAQSSPEIYLPTHMIRTTSDGLQDTISVVDTLAAGDTVRLNVLLNGGFNSLTGFQAQASDAPALDLRLEVDSTLQKMLAAGSDPDKATLVFQPEANLIVCTFWMRFVPQKAGTLPIQMTVSNSAGKEFTPRSYTYSPVVR